MIPSLDSGGGGGGGGGRIVLVRNVIITKNDRVINRAMHSSKYSVCVVCVYVCACTLI